MRVGFFVNDVMTEQVGYTTNRLAMACINRGHEARIIGADSFKYDNDDRIRAIAKHAPRERYKSSETYLKDLQGPKAKQERITVEDLDVLMLRSDPSAEDGRFWARSVGIDFARLAMRQGVLVLNDPNGLSKAFNKMYFQLFPEEVRPNTIISRSKQQIREFAKELNAPIILKPLQGSGGEGVFKVDKGEMSNLNQIVDALAKSGYIIAQEYLPLAANGDTRLFLMNGLPLRYKGKYAAFQRVGSSEDIRSNVHAGGTIKQAELTDQMFRIAEIVRPKLVQDGMFLVGLDIVGDKLMEINVFSPGGLGSAQKFEGANFSHAVVAAMERKIDYIKFYNRIFNNVEMATL